MGLVSGALNAVLGKYTGGMLGYSKDDGLNLNLGGALRGAAGNAAKQGVMGSGDRGIPSDDAIDKLQERGAFKGETAEALKAARGMPAEVTSEGGGAMPYQVMTTDRNWWNPEGKEQFAAGAGPMAGEPFDMRGGSVSDARDFAYPSPQLDVGPVQIEQPQPQMALDVGPVQIEQPQGNALALARAMGKDTASGMGDLGLPQEDLLGAMQNNVGAVPSYAMGPGPQAPMPMSFSPSGPPSTSQVPPMALAGPEMPDGGPGMDYNALALAMRGY